MDQELIADAPFLTAGTAEAVMERAAAISASGMPLPAGLRAAAAETDSLRLSRALRSVAAQLEHGRSLDDVFRASHHRLPPHLAALVRAAQRGGDFGPMVAEWLENRRAARQNWRAVIAALSYPLLTAALAATAFLVFAFMCTGTFKQMYEEFGLKLPALTSHFLWLCELSVNFLPATVGVLIVAAIAMRLFGGRVGWSWLMTNLPLVGTNWHWTGVAEMLRCLSLLVQRRVPLAESLRLTADGIGDAYVAQQCRLLADFVEQGTSLTMALVRLRTLPLSIVPLVRWGEQRDLLQEALRSAAEMIEGRLSVRTDALVQVLPPIIFLLVGGMIGSGIIAVFLPLISLIQGLS